MDYIITDEYIPNIKEFSYYIKEPINIHNGIRFYQDIDEEKEYLLTINFNYEDNVTIMVVDVKNFDYVCEFESIVVKDNEDEIINVIKSLYEKLPNLDVLLSYNIKESRIVNKIFKLKLYKLVISSFKSQTKRSLLLNKFKNSLEQGDIKIVSKSLLNEIENFHYSNSEQRYSYKNGKHTNFLLTYVLSLMRIEDIYMEKIENSDKFIKF